MELVRWLPLLIAGERPESSRHGNPDRGRVEREGGSLLAMGYGILPCRLNSFTLGNPGSAYLRISWVR